MDYDIIAHIRTSETGEKVIQLNDDHCKNVAELASQYAQEFGMGNWGYLIGLLHDIGKGNNGFQQMIRRENGLPYIQSSEKTDHAYIGGIVAKKIFPDFQYIISNVIAGHHRGLYNICTLMKVLDSDIPKEIPPIKLDIQLEKPALQSCEDITHLCRMLFSCLVDADYLDTEKFMNPQDNSLRNKSNNIASLKESLENYTTQFKKAPSTELNKIRTQIQNLCRENAYKSAGFFDLTVPTGGGKTIASIVWAINHALHNNQKRIIIALPYTSIVTQTAQILRNIFGNENVLEHHSAINDELETEKNRLASENWDCPIIITTNVQLFESIFANKTSKCRKLHNITNSVIILDEAQAIPRNYLQPILNALKCYVRLFKVSVLFCTASQPILTGDRRGSGEEVLYGIRSTDVTSIIPQSLNLHETLRRVKISFASKNYTIEDIASFVSDQRKCLCIVNTRKLAYKIYSLIQNDENCFHLSRNMCTIHIRETLTKIKHLLTCDVRDVRVISTQLIEAGVDIDFPMVLRQKSGLDSILQSAGRCNREGHHSLGTTEIFSIQGHIDKGEIKDAVYSMDELLERNPSADWFAKSTIDEYYKILYSKTASFDKNRITEMLKDPTEAQYEEAAQAFKLIDEESSKSIIVNYGDADSIIRDIVNNGLTKHKLRLLRQYSVSVPLKQFEEYKKYGIVEEIFDGIHYISNPNQYDCKTGLKATNNYLESTIII